MQNLILILFFISTLSIEAFAGKRKKPGIAHTPVQTKVCDQFNFVYRTMRHKCPGREYETYKVVYKCNQYVSGKWPSCIIEEECEEIEKTECPAPIERTEGD